MWMSFCVCIFVCTVAFISSKDMHPVTWSGRQFDIFCFFPTVKINQFSYFADFFNSNSVTTTIQEPIHPFIHFSSHLSIHFLIVKCKLPILFSFAATIVMNVRIPSHAFIRNLALFEVWRTCRNLLCCKADGCASGKNTRLNEEK